MNFKFGLSIATEPLSLSSPVIFRGDIFGIIQKAKAIGYDGIELQLRNPEKIDALEIKSYCDQNGLKISGIATGLEYTLNGLSMIDDNYERRLELRKKLFKHVALAEKFNCPVIIGIVRGNIAPGDDKDMILERFRNEMLILSEEAAKYSVTIVLEAINFYVNNYLNTVRQSCDFIDSLNCNNVKLHIDTHHMAIEEYDMFSAIEYAGNRIGYVHFAENNRMYPGAGNTDFWRVMQILNNLKYDGFITLEIVPVPDDETCATLGLEYLKKLCDLINFHPYHTRSSGAVVKAQI